jgi:hypothetical protein
MHSVHAHDPDKSNQQHLARTDEGVCLVPSLQQVQVRGEKGEVAISVKIM